MKYNSHSWENISFVPSSCVHSRAAFMTLLKVVGAFGFRKEFSVIGKEADIEPVANV